MKTTLQRATLAIAMAALAGCASQAPVAKSPAPPVPAPAAPAAPAAAAIPAASAQVFFAVLPDSGRIHAFGDTKNYFDFLSHGEVTLTRTQIGAGPGGRTVVYGITNDDVKANKPSLGEQVMAGTLPAAPGFYGEAMKAGRYYVFGELKDMKDFIAFGEVPYSYTDIGAGPRGESLVYVMNKDSYAKGKPQDRAERFKSLRLAAK
jgi:hypothetical protein